MATPSAGAGAPQSGAHLRTGLHRRPPQPSEPDGGQVRRALPSLPWQTPRRRHWRRWPTPASALTCPSPAPAASIRHRSLPEGSVPTSSIPAPSKAAWCRDCTPPVRCWTSTVTAAATICNGPGPAAIWPGSYDKISRILRIIRNILLILRHFSGFLLGLHGIYRQLIAGGCHSQQHLLRAVISLLPQLSPSHTPFLPAFRKFSGSTRPSCTTGVWSSSCRGCMDRSAGVTGLHGRRQERHRAVVL